MFEFIKRLFRKKQRASEQRFEKEPTTQKQETAFMQKPYRQNDAVLEKKPFNQVETTFEENPYRLNENKTEQRIDRTIEAFGGHEAPKQKSILIEEKENQPRATKQPDRISEPSAPTRKAVAPRVQRNVNSSLGRRAQKSSVYIGLDFGTTFTKAAYEIAPSNVHTKYSIKFGQGDSPSDYYLPSVLYFDPTTSELRISDNTGDLEEIRYFKYNMISDALQKNKVINDPKFITHTSKEQLCCVFFLSHVIYLIRNAVNNSFGHTALNDDTSWYINMGVPLEAHKEDERALLYKKVLEIAYLFERKYHGQTEINIHELDDFFLEHREESNPSMNILPEIYAEVLLYQQYLNTPAGFYTVVDIGGGTEDIATFLKITDESGAKVECLAQNVIGYGYNSISEKVVKSINKASVEKAKSFLNKRIDFNNDSNLRGSVPAEVNYEFLLDARKQCRTLFGACVQRARKTREDILRQTMSARLPMHVFVMGGARDVTFYRSSIEHMKKAQEAAGIPFLKDGDVFDYVGRNTRLEIRNDQRLVISQMLAQPYEMIPEIDKMPWDLKERDVTSKGKSWFELQERQNELYPE